MPASSTLTTYSPDKLIAGHQTTHDLKVTVITGQNLVRGAVVGMITASGKYNLSLSAAADGSQTPVGILVDDTDATAADKEALIYTTGDFNQAALTLGAAHTLASIKAGLADRSIFLIPVQA